MALIYSNLIVVLIWTAYSNGYKTQNLNKEVVERIFNALEKSYDFYELEYKDMNLDGVYGLRVSEGALLKILKEQTSGKLKLSSQVLAKIGELLKKASNAAGKSLPHLKESNPLYYKKFKTLVSKPWENFKRFKRIDNTMYVPVDKRSQISFDEDTSDQCMTQMTGTGKHFVKPCQLTGRCWNLMTAEGADGYALTHQALFLLIGEVQGCMHTLMEKLRSSNKKSLDQVYDRICASMYPQMVAFEKSARKKALYEKDLYMEQAMVCGSMGYYQFLSVTRLDMILKWQRSNGCFGSWEDDNYSKRTLPKASKKRLDLEDALYNYVSGPSRKLMSINTMRKLLFERELKGGCMSHITGVATGLLGVYLRWALHVMYPKHHSTKKVSRDLPGQTHHMVQRKMMQSLPFLTLEEPQQQHLPPVIHGCFILAVIFLLWAFWQKRVVIKYVNAFSCFQSGIYTQIKSRIWDIKRNA